MSEMPLDINGDGQYFETTIYDDGDGIYDYAAVDIDGNGIVDTHLFDTDENGIFETAVQDIDANGSVDSAWTGPNGYALTIGSGPIDVSGASGIVAAAEDMMAPHFADGGLAVPTSTSEPQRFDGYDTDSDGDGFVDALDPNPTRQW